MDKVRNDRIRRELEFLLDLGIKQSQLIILSNMYQSNFNKYLTGVNDVSDKTLDKIENAINSIYDKIKDRKGW